MEYLLAVVALGIGFVLARRGFLHPYDYLVAAALALLVAACLVPAIPDAETVRILDTLGAPLRARARNAFLLDHGLAIIAASVLFAAGAAVESWIRWRSPYGKPV